MHFLFRAPLIQFDITDPKELFLNWPVILAALAISSEDLYRAIKEKNRDTLTPKEWRTVYRYLLRGKYRATPFGRWAGVGIASWEDQEFSNKVSLINHFPISYFTPSPNNLTGHWLNPSLEKWGGGWKFWNFDREREIWRFSKSGESPIIQRIREISIGNSPIEPESVFQPFPEIPLQERKKVWNYLIESQLILPDSIPEFQNNEKREDYFIKQKLAVPEKHRQQLDLFLEEISETLVNHTRPYLERLKERFAESFDDRFVPLKLLWKLEPYLTTLSERQPKNDVDLFELLPIIQSNTESIDLKGLLPKKTKVKKPFHGQVLFRLLDSGRILIDNLSFNRPFVYGGRFTFQPEIYEYFSTQIPANSSILLADVPLCESGKLQSISRHRNLVEYQINCFSGSSSAKELDSSQIYIGLTGNRFELYVPHLDKKLEPIFQHPLNPQYISHPLCRILWEIAHQDLLRPIHYSHPGFLGAVKLPQLTWGDIILQPKKWRLGKEWKTEENLISGINKIGIPKLILAGNQDQELSLDLSRETDRKLFLEELAKKSEVNVFECLWRNDEKKESSPVCYPQFLWGKWWDRMDSNKEFSPVSFNIVDGIEDKSWISVRIILRPDYQQHLILSRISGLVSEFEKESVTTYYFLFYHLTSPEIRFRIKAMDLLDRAKISSKLLSYFNGFPEFEQVRFHPYYPEITKYSRIGIAISETLFFQESKLLMAILPMNVENKLALAVGIGNLLFENPLFTEYWIQHLKGLSKGNSFHSTPESYLTLFNAITPSKWSEFYVSLLNQHPWYDVEYKQERWLGNHLHMVINRIFWEDSPEKESQVFSILYAVLRKRKFGKKSSKSESEQSF